MNNCVQLVIIDIMGNIVDKISEHKYEVALGCLGVSWLVFLHHLRSQNRELREIANFLDPEVVSDSKLLFDAVSTLSVDSICDEYKRYKKNPIYRVALTGGPCAGKSTALISIKEYFTKSGFRVLTVP